MINAEDIERAVLGGIFVAEKVPRKLFRKLPPNVFYKPLHKNIFIAMKILTSMGVQVDQVSIADILLRKKKIEPPDVAVVAELAAEMATTANLEYHSDILIQVYKKRRINGLMAYLKDNNDNPSTDVSETLTTVETELDSLYSLTLDEDVTLISPGNLFRKRMDGIAYRNSVKRIPLYYPSLDNLIPLGMVPSEISVISSRPGVGKSSKKTCLIKRQCDAGLGILNVTLEQPFNTELDKLDSVETQIPFEEIAASYNWKKGDPRKKKIIGVNIKRARDWNLHTLDKPDLTLDELEAYVKQIKEEYGLDVIYIDLFDRIHEIASATNNVHSVISSCLKKVAQIAKRLDIHICLLVQIKRPPNPHNTMPTRDDLKDSGAYEEIARLVILLHRPHIYEKEADPDKMIEIIGKQNNGKAGNHIQIPMIWKEDTMTVVDPKEIGGATSLNPEPEGQQLGIIRTKQYEAPSFTESPSDESRSTGSEGLRW